MKKILKIFVLTFLLTGVMYSTVFAVSPIDNFDKKISESDMFYTNDNYNLTIDAQSTSSDYFVSWGASISQSDLGYIRVQGATKSYLAVDTIGYTLYVERYDNGYWTTIKTFSYSLNNTYEARGNHSLSVLSNNYYRVRSTNYIIMDGLQTTKTSTTNLIYVN